MIEDELYQFCLQHTGDLSCICSVLLPLGEGNLSSCSWLHSNSWFIIINHSSINVSGKKTRFDIKVAIVLKQMHYETKRHLCLDIYTWSV